MDKININILDNLEKILNDLNNEFINRLNLLIELSSYYVYGDNSIKDTNVSLYFNNKNKKRMLNSIPNDK